MCVLPDGQEGRDAERCEKCGRPVWSPSSFIYYMEIPPTTTPTTKTTTTSSGDISLVESESGTYRIVTCEVY